MILRRLSTTLCQRICNNNISFNSNRFLRTSVAEYSFAYGRRDLEKLDECLQLYKDVGDWNKIKGNIISTTRFFNESNIDSVMLQKFITDGSLDTGKEFTNYLRSSGRELNLGTLGHILKFYYNCGIENKINDEEVQYIYDLYDYLNKKYPILDPITITNCILVFSVTPKWKECISLYYKLKENSDVSLSVYSRVIISAFDHGEIDIGWDILEEMALVNKAPKDVMYASWINFCVKKYKQKTLLKSLEKMINFVERHDFLIGQETADLLVNVFSTKIGCKSDFVKIGYSGKCSNCDQILDKIVLNDDEYKLLQDTFYQKVLIGNNVYSKTSPKEIARFLDFLKNSTPYDMVIDGLNIMYSSGNKSPVAQSRLLNAVINNFLKENKRVLVLGRKHMENMIKKYQYGAKSRDIGLFFTEDLSYDDPFLLLAALSSPNCYFISKDLMRSHKFLLQDEKIRVLFKRWQQSRQYMLITITKFGKVICMEPLKYLQTPQKKIGWHIPFNDNIVEKNPYFAASNWICLHPVAKAKTKEKTIK